MGDTYKALVRVVGLLVVAICGLDMAVIILYMTNRSPIRALPIAAVACTCVLGLGILVKLIGDLFSCFVCCKKEDKYSTM